jgi:hypothetical protein
MPQNVNVKPMGIPVSVASSKPSAVVDVAEPEMLEYGAVKAVNPYAVAVCA